MEKEETQKARDRQAKAKAFYAEQGKANPDSDVAYSKLSPEQKEARHDIFKSIPFIGQAAKAADAGAEGLRQVGKYGKDIDPRLAALENLGGKSAMSPDEMSSAWDSKVGGALSAIKKIPGLSMTASDIKAGKDKEFINKVYNNPDKAMRGNFTKIAKGEYNSLPSDKRAAVVTGSGYRTEADLLKDLSSGTSPTDVAKLERLRKFVGRTIPSSLIGGSKALGETDVKSVASPSERGYFPNRSGKGLSLDELLNFD